MGILRHVAAYYFKVERLQAAAQFAYAAFADRAVVNRAYGGYLRSRTAQDEFVVPYGVTSVLGFGGLLRSGELFAVILFSRAPIPEASALRFRAIALDVRSALYAVNEANTWAERPAT